MDLQDLQNRVADITRTGEESQGLSARQLESISARLARTRTIYTALATILGVLAILVIYFILRKN